MSACGPRSGLPPLRQCRPSSGLRLGCFPPLVRPRLGAVPGRADPRGAPACPCGCGPGALPPPQVRADRLRWLRFLPALRGCPRAVVTVFPAGRAVRAAACPRRDGRGGSGLQSTLCPAGVSPAPGSPHAVRCVRVPASRGCWGFPSASLASRCPGAFSGPERRFLLSRSPRGSAGQSRLRSRGPAGAAYRGASTFGPWHSSSALAWQSPSCSCQWPEKVSESLSSCSNSELLSSSL